MGDLVQLRREATPDPEVVLNLWWLSDRPPPAWLGGLAPLVRCEEVAALPVDAPIVVVHATGDIEAFLLLAQVRARCDRGRIVLLAPSLTGDQEAELLDAGATLVADPASAHLARARVQALVEAITGPQVEGDGDDIHQEAERRQAALSVASHLLATLHDEDETFQRLVEIVGRELNSERVSLMRLDREEGILQMRAAVGIPAVVVKEARTRVGEGIAGTCAKLGKPLFVDDHARARSDQTDLEEFVPQGDSSFGSLPMSLTVPILVKGEVVGVVNVTDRADSRPYSKQDIAFISSLMGHAGYLLENAALMTHLRSVRAFSEQVVNTIADPLAVVNADLSVVSWNQRFEREFGGALGEAVELPDTHQARLRQAIDGDASVNLRGWQIGERVYDVRVTPFSGGDYERYLVFLHDVTAHRQMERRLVSAEKMASLGVLAAGVAHEINNPIAFVKANARHMRSYFDDLLALLDLWREGAEKAARREEKSLDLPQFVIDVEEMASQTIEGVERVERIVSGLKSFAHPDTQKTRQAEVSDLLDNAALLTQGKWRTRLSVEKAYDVVETVCCIPSQLEQVFMNLLINAAQAAPNGELRTLTISTHPTERGVAVVFRDDCGGIPDAIVDRIFEPFFTTKDIGEGTGLGLAISYNIIEGHGGTLRVETEAGQGTTFTIELPSGESGAPMVVKQASRYRI